MVGQVGRTISYQISRLLILLWEKKIRQDFNVIVDYVCEKDGLNLADKLQGKARLEKMFRRTLSVEEFNRYRKCVLDLSKIKEARPDLLSQMRYAGRDIFAEQSLECIMLRYNPRPVHLPDKIIVWSSFLLLIPELGRVMSFETSEDFENLQQFEVIRVKNVLNFSTINKLKGVNSRETTRLGRTVSMNEMRFMFRMISDVVLIHRNSLLHTMTFVSTSSGGAESFQIGNYFIIVGKVRKIMSQRMEDGPASERIVTIEDPSGILEFMVNLDRLSQAPTFDDNVKSFFNDETEVSGRILPLDYSGYVLVIGYWTLEEKRPWILYLTQIGKEPHLNSLSRFFAISYMNSRKKVNSDVLKKIYPYVADHSENILIERDGWTYYLEHGWNKDIFVDVIDAHLKKRSRLIKTIETEKIVKYFNVNRDFVELYSSDSPEIEFAKHYEISDKDRCPSCGREMFRVGLFSIICAAKNYGSSLHLTYDMKPDNIREAISGLKMSLMQIVQENSEHAASAFLQKHSLKEGKPATHENALKTCIDFFDIVTNITGIEENQLPNGAGLNIQKQITVFFETSDPLVIGKIHSYFPPKKINVIHNGNNLQLIYGKNCPVHAPMSSLSNTSQTAFLRLLEYKQVEVFNKKQQEKIALIGWKLQRMSSEWLRRINTAFETNDRVSQNDKEEVASKFEEVKGHFLTNIFRTWEGDVMDVSAISKIEINDTMFYIICDVIASLSPRSYEDWNRLFKLINEIVSSMYDEHARRIGNVYDNHLLLKVVAFNYLDYHYKKSLGMHVPYDNARSFYAFLENHLLRCLDMVTTNRKRYGESFRNLRNVDMSKLAFRNLCRMIMKGVITTVFEANQFLNGSKHDIKSKKMFLRNPRTNHITKTGEGQGEQMKTDVFTNRDISEIIFRWKELQITKSKTHSPQLYFAEREKFQVTFTNFINKISRKEPKFKRYLDENPDSKRVSEFLDRVVKNGKYDFENLVAMIDDT